MSFNSRDERDHDAFCCLLSQASGEQLFGTATFVKTWLLLEYPYPWGAKAFEESILPIPTKDRLLGLLADLPESRLEFIKRSSSPYPDRIAFFVVFSNDGTSRSFEFQLSSYNDLLEIEFSDLMALNEKYKNNERKKPFFLVCTNGRRDLCCAKFGFPVFSEMAVKNESNVWQCTHVGGHRFAANVISFPHGIYYGRVGVGEGNQLMETVRKGEIFLERYRGRSAYPGIAQVAEYYLREHTGSMGINAYWLRELKQVDRSHWIVTFLTANGEIEYRLFIAAIEPALTVYKNCADTQASEVNQYALELYEEVAI